MEKTRNEWVIHIWGKKRDTLELNDVEKYHIDLLRTFQSQQKKFDRILVNIALDDINDMNLFNFLKEEVGKVLTAGNTEFKYCQNDSSQGEYVTFRPYVFDRIGENVNVFYSHFKGYSTYLIIKRESFPRRVSDLSEMFWSYIMYRYSLDNMKDVQNKLKNNCVYCWFIRKKNEDDRLKYYMEYHKKLQELVPGLNECVADDLNKHSPGSFMWYNLKNIEKALKDKPLVKSISTDVLLVEDENGNRCTHFCELYLMNFLKEDECYSAKDFNKEIDEMEDTLYVNLYPMKTIGREYLKDFEKYLIENNLL